jgi:hypothetical protein
MGVALTAEKVDFLVFRSYSLIYLVSKESRLETLISSDVGHLESVAIEPRTSDIAVKCRLGLGPRPVSSPLYPIKNGSGCQLSRCKDSKSVQPIIQVHLVLALGILGVHSMGIVCEFYYSILIGLCSFGSLMNSKKQSPSWEADTRSSGKKCFVFCGTRRFITVSIRARHCIPYPVL